MAVMLSKERLQGFVAAYEAIIGHWPYTGDPRELALWSRVIERIPDDLVEDVLRRAAEKRSDQSHPIRLPVLEEALRDAIAAATPREGDNFSQGVDCHVCGNTGTFAVPAAMPSEIAGRKAWTFDPEEAVLSMCAFPCPRCPNGAQRRRKMFPGYSDKTIGEAWAIYEQVQKATGIPEDTHHKSLSQFVAEARDDQVPAGAEWHARIVASIAADMRRRGQPVPEDFGYYRSGVTLERLRKRGELAAAPPTRRPTPARRPSEGLMGIGDGDLDAPFDDKAEREAIQSVEREARVRRDTGEEMRR